VLVSAFGNAVIELDAEGKESAPRAVAGAGVVEPLPRDHLLVGSLAGKIERSIGKARSTGRPNAPQQPLDARRLPDGTTIVACWAGCVILFDAAGKELWNFPNIRAVDVEPLWNGNFLVVGHEDKQLVELNPKGKLVWRLALPDPAMDVDVLPNGKSARGFDKARRIDEYAREGKVVATCVPPSDPED